MISSNHFERAPLGSAKTYILFAIDGVDLGGEIMYNRIHQRYRGEEMSRENTAFDL